jgi:hypothetical protein
MFFLFWFSFLLVCWFCGFFLVFFNSHAQSLDKQQA